MEDVEYAKAASYLHDFVEFHAQRAGELDLLHQLNEVLGVRILPYLELHAKAVNQQFDQRLILNLELDALVQHLLDEDLQLYP